MAQAVLELNKEDGGNRKFILVQLPEKTDNPQFPTITHICRERVKRVIQKMKAADTGKLALDSDAAQDRGFKAFRLSESNFKIWDAQAATTAEALQAQLEAFADNILPGATDEDLLFETLLKSGFDLSAKREIKKVDGGGVHFRLLA